MTEGVFSIEDGTKIDTTPLSPEEHDDFTERMAPLIDVLEQHATPKA